MIRGDFFSLLFSVMRRFLFTFFLLIALFAECAFSAEPGVTKIAVITDIHYLDAQLAVEGKALSAYEKATGRTITDLHAVLDVVLDGLTREAPDVLLVTGDISNHGEKRSHLGFIEKLRPLQNKGTRILVIPGNHDVNIPDAKTYAGEKSIPVETVSKEEFAALYAPFGYNNALKRDDASLSYLAEINESVWLICFDTNRYDEHTTTSVSGGRLRPGTTEWALSILREAKEKGIKVLGMMHHGLVEHFPYQETFFPQYLIDDWEMNADRLADAGLKVVFTGHFHANDVTMHTSPSGQVVYDVETASLAQFPFAYRIMELDDAGLSIDTRFVTAVPGNPDLAKVYRDRLEIITRRVAKKRLEGVGIPMSEEALHALTEVIVKMNLLHVQGDEKPDMTMMAEIRALADLMDSEVDQDSLSLDFPPEDNRLLIPIQ